nr:hypothetical protein [Micromonospora sp. DSM 115978]
MVIVVAFLVAISTVLLLRAWLRPSDEMPAPGADGAPLAASSEQDPGSSEPGLPGDSSPTAGGAEDGHRETAPVLDL